MYGTKTLEKAQWNSTTGKDELITKAPVKLLSNKVDAIPYENTEAFIISIEEFNALKGGGADMEVVKKIVKELMESGTNHMMDNLNKYLS